MRPARVHCSSVIRSMPRRRAASPASIKAKRAPPGLPTICVVLCAFSSLSLLESNRKAIGIGQNSESQPGRLFLWLHRKVRALGFERLIGGLEIIDDEDQASLARSGMGGLCGRAARIQVAMQGQGGPAVVELAPARRAKFQRQPQNVAIKSDR